MKRFLAILVTVIMVTTLLVPSLAVFADEADYSDMVLGDKPANIVADPDNSEGKFKQNYTFNMLTIKDDRYIYGEKARGVDTYWCAGDHYISSENGGLTETLEPYANYVVSARLRNETPEVGHPPVFGVSSNVNGSNTANGGTIISIPVVSPEYETYAGVLTVNNQAGSLICIGQDSTINRSSYTEFAALAMDRTNGGSLYIAKEVAYDVKVEALGIAKVFPGDEIKVKAEIVNQVGIAYGTDHNFTYTALNADRTAVEEGITVTKNGDGTATVSFADDIAVGNYVIFAESTDEAFAGFKRGMTIEVVDSSAFADTTPVMPTNLITTPKSYNFKGGNGNVGTSWAAGSSRWLNLEAKKDLSYTPGSWYAVGVGMENTAYGNTDLLPNTTYAYKATIKAVGDEPPYFNIEYNGNASKVTTNEYGTTGYAPGYEPEVYAATFNTGANTSGKMWIGLISGKAGNAVHLDVTGSEKYLGVEAEYEVSNVITGRDLVFAGGSTTLKTQVLNQVGIKGTLDQTVTYVVLNDTRSDFEHGITVIPGKNGEATVEVAEGVVAGTYNILAISKNGFIKSAQIEVVTAESFADKTAVKPANFLLDPGNKASYPNDNTGLNYAFGNLISNSYNGQPIVEYTEKTGKADAYWGAGPTSVPAAYKNASYEMDKTYVISVRLMNGAPEKKATVKAGFSYKAGRGTPVSWDVSNSDDFQTYTATFKPTIADGAAVYIGFAGDVDRTNVTDEDRGVLLLDYSNGGSLYIAEEVPYEVKNVVTGATELWPGDTTTLATEVVNQVGMKSTMVQDVTYVVLNSERDAFADGITVTEGADGTATVEVGNSVAGGEYVILAISDEYGFQKAATITVLTKDSFADHVKGERPQNLLIKAKDYSYSGGNSGSVNSAWVDSSAKIWSFSGKSDFAANSFGAHGVKLVGYNNTENALLANKSYVYTTWIKTESGTPKFSIGISGAIAIEHPNGYTPGDEYEEYKATFKTGAADAQGIWVGLHSGTAEDVLYQNFAMGTYLAEEAAHDIVIDSYETELLPGEFTQLSAQVLNQIETTGTLEQEFTWYALNANRTGFVDGITIDVDEDGLATVEVADSVAPGKYVIYAKSSYGIGKGVEIEVVTNKARVVYTEIFTIDDKASFYAGVEGLICDTVKFVIASYNTAANKLIEAKEVKLDVVDGFVEMAGEGVAPVVSIAGADEVRVFVWDADTLTPIKFNEGVRSNLWAE